MGRGQTVALVHQNNQALDVQAQMEELAMEIELLDYAMNQTDDVVSAARLDESILQSLASLRFASASGSYRQLDDDVMELKSQVLKRSYTYGEGLDSSQLSALRQSLIEEYRALRTQSSSVTSRITAPAAGVFSSLADGYESLLTPQSILTMTPADLDALAGQQVTAPPAPPAAHHLRPLVLRGRGLGGGGPCACPRRAPSPPAFLVPSARTSP